MGTELGLRERKKLRTRQLIAETARRLFAERGFDAVAVSEVARQAEVSEATVFNYFPTKEDLVFQGMEIFEAELLAAVRQRPAGESIASAFGRFVLQPRGFLATADHEEIRHLTEISTMIATSPTLLTREREIIGRYTASLAALIAEETGAALDDLRPWATAYSLMGLHQSLIGFVRRRLAEGISDGAGVASLARELRRRGQAALRLLEHGLAAYGVEPAGGGGHATSARRAPRRAGSASQRSLDAPREQA